MTGIIAMRAVRKHIRWSLTVAIAVGLMVALPSSALAQGKPNKECSTSLIAKFEARGPNLVFEKGVEGAITISNVGSDDDGEPASFDWTATTEVGSVIVKGGQATKVFSGDTTSIDFGSPPAISNVRFCAPDEITDTDETTNDSDDEGDKETIDDSEDETTDGGADVSDTDNEANSGANIPLPTRVDTGAGGSSRPSFEKVFAVLAFVFVTAGCVTAEVIRRRG